MLKRIISSLIIFSMLWIDVVAAMDKDDVTPPSSTILTTPLIRSPSKSLPRNDGTSTERSVLLGEGKRDPYNSLTRMEQFPPSPHRSINEVNKSDSSSDEECKGLEHDLRHRLEESESKKKTCCCWAPSWPACCRAKPSLLVEEGVEHLRESEHLFVEAKKPSLSDIRRKALLTLLIPPDEELPSDVILLDEQPMEERDRLLHNALALAKEFKGTSLEDFGRWYQGHVLNGGWRLLDFGGLLAAGAMAAGTGAAMSPIVEWSVYNKYLAKNIHEYRPFVLPLAYYINTTTALIAFTDAVLFMADATAPSTRAFTVPKGAREKRADRALIALALLPGAYLLLLGFQIQQAHKKFTNTTGWWNEYDQFWYFTSLGFFPYLFAQTFLGARAAVSRRFHPTISEHVLEDVLALRQLEARMDEHLSDPEIHELYTFFTQPLFAESASKLKKWATYFFKGEMADTAKVEGVFTYLCLRKYAKESLKGEEENPQTCCTKSLASRIMSGLGTPAGFGVISISLFGLFQSFMGPIPALTLSLTGATLGFLPGALVQSHNLEEALDTIKEGIIPYLKGKGGALKETLKDPYAWGRGVGKAWAFFQNTLTNLAPILVSLGILIPEYLGGSSTTQTAMTGVMLGLAIPYVISELINGTVDISRHVMTISHFVQDVYKKMKKFVAACCGSDSSISPDDQRRWLKERIRQSIDATLGFTPDHVEKLNALQRRLEGEKEF